MRTATHLLRIGTLGLALVLLGCGSSQPSPLPKTRSALPSVVPSLRSLVPLSTPQPSGSFPAGVRVIDTASGFRALRLSPEEDAVAALTAGPASNDRRVDILTIDGALLGSFVADDVVWLAPERLVAVDAETEHATLRDRTGRILSTISTNAYGLVVAGSHVLLSTFADGADAGNEFHPLIGDRLGPLVQAPGQPRVLSPDGDVLGLLDPLTTVILANTGGPAPARVVAFGMRLAERLRVAETPVDDRLPLLISGDGRWLVGVDLDDGADAFEVGTRRMLNLPGFPFGWTPDGRLILVREDGSSWLWRPPIGSSTGAPVPSGLPAGYPTFGSDMTHVAIVKGRDAIAPHVIVRSPRGSVDVPLLAAGSGTRVAWTADGRICLVDSGTRDAQRIESHVLRVDVP